MFFTIKLYLNLNCVLMLNWIVWNRTIFIKMDLVLNNLQRLICHNPPHLSLASSSPPPHNLSLASFLSFLHSSLACSSFLSHLLALLSLPHLSLASSSSPPHLSFASSPPICHLLALLFLPFSHLQALLSPPFSHLLAFLPPPSVTC